MANITGLKTFFLKTGRMAQSTTLDSKSPISLKKVALLVTVPAGIDSSHWELKNATTSITPLT